MTTGNDEIARGSGFLETWLEWIFDGSPSFSKSTEVVLLRNQPEVCRDVILNSIIQRESMPVISGSKITGDRIGRLGETADSSWLRRR